MKDPDEIIEAKVQIKRKHFEFVKKNGIDVSEFLRGWIDEKMSNLTDFDINISGFS